MVKTTMRNIFMGVIQYKNPYSRKYILAYPYVKVFIFQALYLRDIWYQIDAVLTSQDSGNSKQVSDL
jgi:hypothetical protein